MSLPARELTATVEAPAMLHLREEDMQPASDAPYSIADKRVHDDKSTIPASVTP